MYFKALLFKGKSIKFKVCDNFSIFIIKWYGDLILMLLTINRVSIYLFTLRWEYSEQPMKLNYHVNMR